MLLLTIPEVQDMHAAFEASVATATAPPAALAAVHAAIGNKSAEMKTLVRLAFGGWSQHSHWLHTEGVRVAVVTTLTVATHLVNTPAAALPNIPPEIWRVILNFLARRDWPTRGATQRGGPAEARNV